jgi:hypothetical protein
LNVHNVSDGRQTEIHAAEPLVPGPSHLEVEISIAKLNKNKSPGSDQVLAELYQAGGEILVSVIHKLITSICNKEELFDQWKACGNLPHSARTGYLATEQSDVTMQDWLPGYRTAQAQQ